MSIRLFHTQRLRACCCGGDSGGADASHGAASRTIALAGNQNCGKTTLFNLLTGRHQHTGNWPGVTVERVSGRVAARNWEIVDLPGLYALSPYSAEEVVSREFLESPACDVILNVVDVTHPERSLGLTLELMLLGKPMVVVLNMCDLVSDELRPSPQKLAQELGVPVVLVSAASGTGLEDLYAAVEQARHEDMLVVDYDTPFIHFRLPPLTLQPIVENAVKHGMDLDGEPLRILIQTRHTDTATEIIVEDTGTGFDSSDESTSHTTLTNIRQRLEMMCHGKMTITPREGGGTMVKLTIPG